MPRSDGGEQAGVDRSGRIPNHRRVKRYLFRSRAAALVGILFFALPLTADAQMSSRDAIRALSSSDAMSADELAGAFLALTESPDRRAITPISARIRRGLPPEPLAIAIGALAATERREAGEVLIELTSHRRAEIRVAALNALKKVRAPGVEAALRLALSDADPQVRAVGATALGEVGTPGSLDTLFHSLERGNMEAAGAIGKLARDQDVERVLGYIGQVPFAPLTSSFSELLSRDDISDANKTLVIEKVAELATDEARAFLTAMIDVLPNGNTKETATAAVRAMEGS